MTIVLFGGAGSYLSLCLLGCGHVFGKIPTPQNVLIQQMNHQISELLILHN